MSYPYNGQGHPNQPPIQYPPQMMQMPPMQMHHMMPMYGQHQQMPVYMPPHMIPPGHQPPQPPQHPHQAHQPLPQQQQQQHLPQQPQAPEISQREQQFARKCSRTEREIQQLTMENNDIQEEWIKAVEILQRITAENSMLVEQINKTESLHEAPATSHNPTKKEMELFNYCHGRNFYDPGE